MTPKPFGFGNGDDDGGGTSCCCGPRTYVWRHHLPRPLGEL